MDSIVHFEIPMDDEARAKKFYAETFGWQLKDVPEMSYIMATTVDKANPTPGGMSAINGGMMKKGIVNGPSMAINVADIDAATEKVKANGGKIVKEKIAVGDMGFMVYFKDTEGNVMSLWQSAKKA
jgi:predicted enzyme related to lactoylglutathione lyase